MMEVKPEQKAKQYSPIDVTKEGIWMEVRAEQP